MIETLLTMIIILAAVADHYLYRIITHLDAAHNAAKEEARVLRVPLTAEEYDAIHTNKGDT